MDKKKVFIFLLIIVVVGTLLRFINIDKQEGMWNDEYLTWEIAKASFPVEFFRAIMSNCHAPLHYIYLKIWIYFFKDSDISLRLSSLVPGVLSIISMFFAGRELGKKASNEAGIVAGGFCAISSFLIYFSQEVRIYSLLFFLTSINIFFALKTLDNPSKKNCTFFVITSLLVMLEHTIGFVFVFFSSIGVILFASKKEKFKKFLITSLLVALIIFIPVGIFLYNVMFNQQYFSQWWAPFSWAKLAFFFTDLFSPRILNITNAPPGFLKMLYDGQTLNFGFLLFAFVPFLTCVFFMLKALFTNFDNKIKYFVLVSIGVYLTVFTASLFNKIVFLTKYMIEIYPALILIMVAGFVSFKNKNFKVIVATVYTVLCLFFIFASNYSPVKLVRSEGQNIPVIMLKDLEYKNDDKILFLYYPKTRFSKYSKEISENKNAYHISKYDFPLIKDENEKMKDVYKSGKITYKEVFRSFKNKSLDLFLTNNIYSNLKTGDRFFLVDFSPVSIFNPEIFYAIMSIDKEYDKMPFLFLVFSYIKNYVIAESSSKLSFEGTVSLQDWTIYVFRKT